VAVQGAPRQDGQGQAGLGGAAASAGREGVEGEEGRGLGRHLHHRPILDAPGGPEGCRPGPVGAGRRLGEAGEGLRVRLQASREDGHGPRPDTGSGGDDGVGARQPGRPFQGGRGGLQGQGILRRQAPGLRRDDEAWGAGS
jgi:hypothetical protein